MIGEFHLWMMPTEPVDRRQSVRLIPNYDRIGAESSFVLGLGCTAHHRTVIDETRDTYHIGLLKTATLAEEMIQQLQQL